LKVGGRGVLGCNLLVIHTENAWIMEMTPLSFCNLSDKIWLAMLLQNPSKGKVVERVLLWNPNQ